VSDLARLCTTVALKMMTGERRATADVLFVDRGDSDREAFGPKAFPPANVPTHRLHESLRGGSAPPFGVARISEVGGKYVADISFLDTPRGNEEYVTAKALDAAGVVQPVSVSFERLETADVPAALKATGVRQYTTRGRFIELSFVGIGAVPHAQITAVKCATCQAKVQAQPLRPVPTDAELAAAVARGKALGESLRAEPTDGRQWFAARVLQFEVAFWGMKRPGLRWFEPDGQRLGQAFVAENIIALDNTLRGANLIETIGHELTHIRNPWLGEAGAERLGAMLLERWTREHDA